MALYGRASSSTYSLFLTSGQISHLLAYIPRPVLKCVAFSALSLFYTTLRSSTAWLFVPFLASTPRHTLSLRGFFSSFLLLHPHATLGRVAFFTISCSYTTPRSLWRGFFRRSPFLCPICIESTVYIWICSVITRRRTRLLGFASSTNSLPFHKHALPTVCNTRYLRVLFRH